MQEKIQLDTSDEHVIYGILDVSVEKSDTLTIFVHGLTGHPNEHTLYNAARQFPSEGIDTFRFSLYTGEKGGRRLRDCTIMTHAIDLDRAVEHFRSQYRTIAVVGHSLGSPTILRSDMTRMDNIILWDPSYLAPDDEDLPKRAVLDGEEVYVEEWGTAFLMDPKMIEEWKWFNGENELEIISKISVPLKIIAAGNGMLMEGGKRYSESSKGPTDFAIIEGAGHTFDEEGVEDRLLSETLSWIKQHQAA